MVDWRRRQVESGAFRVLPTLAISGRLAFVSNLVLGMFVESDGCPNNLVVNVGRGC